MYGDNFSLLQFPSLLKRSVLSVGLDLAIMLSSDQQKLQKKQSITLLFFATPPPLFQSMSFLILEY